MRKRCTASYTKSNKEKRRLNDRTILRTTRKLRTVYYDSGVLNDVRLYDLQATSNEAGQRKRPYILQCSYYRIIAEVLGTINFNDCPWRIRTVLSGDKQFSARTLYRSI